MAYASKTEVSVEKTEAEIKSLIRRYGATKFMSFDEPGLAVIAFQMHDRHIRFNLPLPRADADEFKYNGRRQARTAVQRSAAWEQACRSRWRALMLCIRAKLESVEAGIEHFEDAFLAHIQLGDGQTVGEVMRPQIAAQYAGGNVQLSLPKPN